MPNQGLARFVLAGSCVYLLLVSCMSVPHLCNLLWPFRHECTDIRMRGVGIAEIASGAPYAVEPEHEPSEASEGCSSATMSTQSSWFDGTSVASDDLVGATTVMVQNLPRLFSQKDLMNSLDMLGFEGTYDFCYLPVCFTNGHCRGYAFINFRRPTFAARLLAEWQDAKYLLNKKQKKPLLVTFAETQGLTALLAQPQMKRMQRVRNVEFRPFLADEIAVQ
eukprot:3001030-Amphidinium_carterae.1